MRIAKSLDEFLLLESSSSVVTGKWVAKYIKELSEEGEEPDYFIQEYVLPNKFELTTINLKDLLKTDETFEEFYNSKAVRDDADDLDRHDLDLPIVVHDNKILDGYHRSSQNLRMHNDEVSAYVSIPKAVKTVAR